MPIVILLIVVFGIAKIFTLSYWLVLEWTGGILTVIVTVKLIMALLLRKKFLNNNGLIISASLKTGIKQK